MIITDNELLGLFVLHQDQDAFEQIIRRHGPMVLDVCKSVLWQTADSEDAFQAVFLLLSEKAPKLLVHNSISGWLHETSFRISSKSRSRIARKREVKMLQEPKSSSNEPWLNIAKSRDRELLHREINGLPKRYREVIVMCCLEGKSRSQTADILEVSVASVKASLSRGRKMLRQRLVRHGVAFSIAMGTVGFMQSKASATCVSEVLIQSTINACNGLAPMAGVGTGAGVAKSLLTESAFSWMSATQVSFAAATSFVVLGIATIATFGISAGEERVKALNLEYPIRIASLASAQIRIPQESQNDEIGFGFASSSRQESSNSNDSSIESNPPESKWVKAYREQFMNRPFEQDNIELTKQDETTDADGNEKGIRSKTEELSLLDLEQKLKLYHAFRLKGDEDTAELSKQIANLRKAKLETDQFKSKIADLEMQIVDLSSKLGESHPSVHLLRKKLIIRKQLMNDVVHKYLEQLSPGFNDRAIESKRRLLEKGFLSKKVGGESTKGTSSNSKFKGKLSKIERKWSDTARKTKPKQKGIQFDEFPSDDSQVRIEKLKHGVSGYQFFNRSSGHQIREFIDIDGDGEIDSIVFMKNGKETYREVDTDADGKPDQFQFRRGKSFHYGFDDDRDGNIDRWSD